MLRLSRPLVSVLRGCNVLRRARLYSILDSAKPWFVDQEYTGTGIRQAPPPASTTHEKPLPPDLPAYLLSLYPELLKSPHLERGGVEICPPPSTEPGPPLPSSLPKGKRQRGRTEFGQGIPDLGGGLWKWIVITQVKEGTENRGAIESVMRIVRRTLLKGEPPVNLPPNKKRRVQDGWGMLDAGDFAVHVLSRSAREKYFPVNPGGRRWEW